MKLLQKPSAFVNKFLLNNEFHIKFIMAAKKAVLLFHNSFRGEFFDVSMDSYEEAELCDIIVMYILNLRHKRFLELWGHLYRDNGIIDSVELLKYRKQCFAVFVAFLYILSSKYAEAYFVFHSSVMDEIKERTSYGFEVSGCHHTHKIPGRVSKLEMSVSL